jgi:hypothetical protein
MNVLLHTSNLPYALYYPAYQLSRFAKKCELGERSKLHYFWIIPTQLLCTAVTTPLLLTCVAIHFLIIQVVLIPFIGEHILMAPYGLNGDKYNNTIEDERRFKKSNKSLGERPLYQFLLATHPDSSSGEITTKYESIVNKIYFHDILISTAGAFMDSAILSVVLFLRLFKPSWNCDYVGFSRDQATLWNPMIQPRAATVNDVDTV